MMDFWTILLIVILVGVVLAVVLLVLDLLKWRHTVIIKEILAHGKKLIVIKKARDHLDENGGNFWILKGEKDILKKYIEVPTSNSIEHNFKGKKVATMYRDESGAYLWANDEVISLGDDKFVKPMLTSHRVLDKQNIERANNRNNMFWSKNLPIIIAVSAAIILVTIALLFTPDVMDSLTGRYKQMEQTNKVMIELVKEVKSMNSNIQIVAGVDVNSSGIPD